MELGHNLRSCKSKVRIRCKDKESSKKMCKYCGKLDKGHICPRFEINKCKIYLARLEYPKLCNAVSRLSLGCRNGKLANPCKKFC